MLLASLAVVGSGVTVWRSVCAVRGVLCASRAVVAVVRGVERSVSACSVVSSATLLSVKAASLLARDARTRRFFRVHSRRHVWVARR